MTRTAMLGDGAAEHRIRGLARPLELRLYHCFVVLAEERHFARAAERIGIGQSNLSREIKAIESAIGVKLFHRTSRRTELSPAGELLLEPARRVLAAEARARISIAELKRDVGSSLCIGISERLSCSRIASAIATWRGTQRELHLRVSALPESGLITGIEEGLLEAGIIASASAGRGFRLEPLWSDPWVVALPRTGPFVPGSPNAEISDVTKEPIALLAPTTNGDLDHRISEMLHGVNPQAIVAERPSSVAALALWVEAGCGVGLTTAVHAEALRTPSLTVRRIRRGLPPVQVQLMHRDEAPSPQVSRLIECLRAARG